jgi:hypothetical protein
MTENANADEVTRLRDAVAGLHDLWQSAECVLTCVQQLADETEKRASDLHATGLESAAAVHDTFAADLRAALDLTSRANRRRAAASPEGHGGCDPGAVEYVRDDGGPWRRAALDPASPATRPSPAPADDEGTGTGAAPSEGHSEAQGGAR